MTEFGLIDHIRTLCAALPDAGFEGIGDDCAVLPVGGNESLVFTTDLLCEGIHFLRHSAEPRTLAGKALAVNLSDVAAMGARPIATLLSLALPADATGRWAEEFVAGYCAASERWKTALVGGDTTSAERHITISVTAIGRVSDRCLKRRSAARSGDAILVTGTLGASGRGLRDLLEGRPDTEAARIHLSPEPQIEEGLWLGGRTEVHAMMDLSDGLASDIRRILAESHAGAEIDLERIPVAEGSDLETALCGGEDYRLLLTADAAQTERLCADFHDRFGRTLHRVGRITGPTDGRALWLRGGEPQPLDYAGFEHF